MVSWELKNEDLCELVEDSRSEAHRKAGGAEEMKEERKNGSMHGPVFEEDGEDQRVPRQLRSVAKISEGRLKQILCLKKNQGKRNLNGKLSG